MNTMDAEDSIDRNAMDAYWAQQFAEDYAEFVMTHGMAAA